MKRKIFTRNHTNENLHLQLTKKVFLLKYSLYHKITNRLKLNHKMNAFRNLYAILNLSIVRNKIVQDIMYLFKKYKIKIFNL